MYVFPGHPVATGPGRAYRDGSLGRSIASAIGRTLGADPAQTNVGLSQDMIIGIVLGAAAAMVYFKQQKKGSFA